MYWETTFHGQLQVSYVYNQTTLRGRGIQLLFDDSKVIQYVEQVIQCLGVYTPQ